MKGFGARCCGEGGVERGYTTVGRDLRAVSLRAFAELIGSRRGFLPLAEMREERRGDEELDQREAVGPAAQAENRGAGGYRSGGAAFCQ